MHTGGCRKGRRFQDLTVIKINQCEINSLIPASTFEIEFPKGTEADELADSPPRPQPAQRVPQTAPPGKGPPRPPRLRPDAKAP